MKWKNQYPSDRSAYWDNMKGCLIFLVVFAHFLFGIQENETINIIVDSIYFFHMPAFAFVSGCFSKSPHSRSKESVLRILSAFILFHGFIILLEASPASSVKLLESYYSEWYLVALIIWRLSAPYITRFKRCLPITIIISLLIGFFPAGGNETFAINKVVTFLPFFIAGFLYQESMVERIKSRSRAVRILVCAVTVFFAALIEYLCISRLSITDSDLLAYNFRSIDLVGPIIRLAIIIVSVLMIIFLLNASTEKRVPILTTAGKNSLAVYLLHRPVTLVFYGFVLGYSSRLQILLSLVGTVIFVVLFGSDLVAGFIGNVLDRSVAVLMHKGDDVCKYQNLFRTFFYSFLCAIILYPVVLGLLMSAKSLWPVNGEVNDSYDTASSTGYEPIEETDPIYRVMSSEKKAQYDNAFRILFAGDLILLEDQIKRAYDGNNYDFSDCFEYTRSYINEADFSIGVFEGPMGGAEHNYSSSNYEDGKALSLNFPDEWGQSVMDAGFDLVTTANNHALDMGEEGLIRTIDLFDKLGLDHTGTYRNLGEKELNHIKIVENEGIRLAILSYTMFVNNVSEDELVSGALSYLTSMIVSEDSPDFSSVKTSVEQDFEQAKTADPDLIIVLPHWGTQFADFPDESQLIWEKTFKECGADIILGDHTHSVQPVTMDESSFTLFCPGNYANIYREHNGDCSALVEVYIDRGSKEVIGGSVIPMWVSSSYKGNYRAVPIYDIINDPSLGNSITTYDMERVNEVLKHITKVMLRHEMDLNMIQQRYYFDDEGFMRTKASPIEPDEEMKESAAYKSLITSDNVCFVGDSVTEGTKNGGVPWYEPLEGLISRKVINCGWGSATTGILLRDHLDEIVGDDADLYVIAIGANDVRYRDENSAMNADEYTENLAELRAAISEKNPAAGFIFVAPWTSTDGDIISKLGYQDKVNMNAEYTQALEGWTEANGDLFVDANDYIDEYLTHYPQSDYLIDCIHPNATKGVELYSEAFLCS